MPAPPFPPLPPVASLVERVVSLCREASDGVEFTTFLVGVRARRLLRDVPEDQALAWKGDLRRAAGRTLGEEWAGSGRRADFERPELLLLYDADRGRVEATRRAVHVYGRYRKLVRDLPQTHAHWKHAACAGEGCAGCQSTGRAYPVALEDLLGAPAAKAFQAAEWRFHGLGREDVDVRCLGAGRPFVLELCQPRLRRGDLEAIAREVAVGAAGRVELAVPLRMVGEHVVPRLKGSEARKTYRARVRPAGAVDAAALEGLGPALTGKELEQRTPERVSRRRADLVRPRTVHVCELLGADGEGFDLRVTTDSGTYIKELISGDDGRTRPSVAELLGVPCVCAELDVLEVDARDDVMVRDDQGEQSLPQER